MQRKMIEVLEGLKDEYATLCNAFLNDTSVRSRLVGVGVISQEAAFAQGMVGPFARASNVNNDVRCYGNGAYGKLSDFQPILDTDGDCYARVKVRALEVLQSIDIIEELLVEKAVLTPDMGGVATTAQVGDEVVRKIREKY
jgi:ech hydrogenase subunit E